MAAGLLQMSMVPSAGVGDVTILTEGPVWRRMTVN